jgi:hypothetical protein
MSNLTPTPGWDNVVELPITTAALGGPGGPMNLQAQALTNRTEALNPDAAASEPAALDGTETWAFKKAGVWARAKLSNIAAYIVKTATAFIQNAAGAIARAIQDKLRETVSVKDFGAVGDTVLNGSNAFVSGADDTLAIRAALDYAATIKGCRVKLPAGRYKVSDSLGISGTGVTLEGPGEIYYTLPPFAYNHCLIIGGVDCGAIGVRMRSDPAALRNTGYGFGISVSGATNATVERCTLNDIPSAGVWVSASTRTRVHGNVVISPKADGIHFSDGANGFTCTENRVYASGDDAFAAVWDSGPSLSPPQFGTFHGNIAYGNVTGNGFNLSSCHNVIATGNYSYFSSSCGFSSYLWGSNTAMASNIVIEGNSIISAGQNPANQAGAAAIYVGALMDSSIKNNRIDTVSIGPAWSGATAYAVGQIVSSGGSTYRCIVANTNQAPPNATYWVLTYTCAIYVYAYRRVDIDNNEMRNIAGHGVWCADATPSGPTDLANMSITKNKFYNVARRSIQYALTATPTSGLFVTDNQFTGCGYTTADYNIYIKNGVAAGNPVRVYDNRVMDLNFQYRLRL